MNQEHFSDFVEEQKSAREQKLNYQPGDFANISDLDEGDQPEKDVVNWNYNAQDKQLDQNIEYNEEDEDSSADEHIFYQQRILQERLENRPERMSVKEFVEKSQNLPATSLAKQ